MGKGIGTHITLGGGQDLQRFLKELPRRALKTALRQAVNAGGTPVAKAVRRLAPKESGLLKRSIGKKVKAYPDGNALAIIGSNRGTVGDYQGQRRVPGNYIHLVALGVKPHSVASGANSRKRVSASTMAAVGGGQHPGHAGSDFVNAGYRQALPQAKTAMEAKLKTALDKQAQKLRGKG